MQRISLILAAAAALSVAPAVRADDAGRETYDKKCASCHAKDGSGKTKMGEKLKVESLASAEKQGKLTDDQLKKIVEDGIQDKKMPGFKEKLSAEEIDGVAKYVRAFKK